MSRYIDFELAREYIHKVCEGLGGNGGLMLKIKFDELPTADVVEVVRCKDCKFYQDNNDGYPNQECRWKDGETPNTDDYCSYGEVKK